jgi:penicillin-binding protein-related factor A (putative recombinase)
MSTQNQGTWFERDIGRIADAYREKQLLDISKVDPPTRVIWIPAAKRKPGQPAQTVLQLANPFLDYMGTWTERAGRAVFLEAKSTSEPRLPLMQDSGLKQRQIDSLSRWARGGAAVGVLWGHANAIRFVPLAAVQAQLAAGVKHLKWEHARVVQPGFGWCTWDFLQALRVYHPEG